jgi:glycosyltransferase involved in cell wall biosynthesis
MKRAVVIPCYKAERSIAAVVDSLPREILEEGAVVMVNDGSPDGTGAAIDAVAARVPAATALHHPANRGYGGALKTGMRHAMEQGFDIFAVVHSDGQYAPSLVLQLCEPIEKGLTEIAQGSRMRGGARSGEHPMPLSRYIPNRVLTALENLTVGTSMADFHSGYMIYSRRLLGRVPFERVQDNYNFDAEMIIMAHLCGIR